MRRPVHNNRVLQRDVRQHVADAVLGELFDVVRSGSAVEHDMPGLHDDGQIAHLPARAGTDGPLKVQTQIVTADLHDWLALLASWHLCP